MLAALLAVSALLVRAETGRDAWLRYAPVANNGVRPQLPATVVVLSPGDPVMDSAKSELIRGVRGMFGHILRVDAAPGKDPAIVLATVDALKESYPQFGAPLAKDGYRIGLSKGSIIIAGANAPGVLYGVFAVLRHLAAGEPVTAEQQEPYSNIRWVNHWDNLDSTIERGYGGPSIFWDKGTIRADLTRVSEYARLLASIGINACSINNVNANIKAIDRPMLDHLKRVAAAMRPWGVRMALSLDFGAPKSLGGLDTFDPADARVQTWWAYKVEEIYHAVPDLAGFVVKADSEGRVGPSAYGRTHADAANVIARPARTFGGLVFYRGFVYDHHMDWRNLKNDRARAAYDNLHALDGQFADNVVLQIKHGPIDFQVREPASPLFAGLEKTNQAIELQITQEYFGQGRLTVYLAPMWKTVLDFDMRVEGKPSPVKALASGRVFHRPKGGFIGVSNAGMDENWYGNHMSQANLYAFGRLAWNPDLSAAAIIGEWTRQTFGNDPKVVATVNAIQLASWRDFENYTGNLGLQTLTEITGTHYGPAVEASERNGWGQWHRSDEKGAGMDRTVATGTGYIGQYPPEVARVFDSLATCPDELLLFFHHVPYTHKLHSGKTVIQHIYDAHYEGAAAAARYVDQWKPLAGLVDERRYLEVLNQLDYQSGSAEEWRDSITRWFFKTSGIADAKNRVNQHPGRVEAEAMTLNGYTPAPAVPWETASGGTAIVCPKDKCEASFEAQVRAAGWHRIRVRYFDRNDGVSHFRLFAGDQVIDEWDAADHFPSRKLDGASSTLRRVPPVWLRPGDRIRIEGAPGGAERAPLDYIELEEAKP